MADAPFTSFAGVPSQDVVGVYGEDFNQMFLGARPIRAQVRETGKLMNHPLETGESISDHFIILPVEILLAVILTPETFTDTYQQIKSAWQNTTELTVQTKADTYSNMYVLEIPHDETPDQFDTISIAIKLQSAQFVEAQFEELPAAQVKEKSNASTVEKGQQSGSAATQSQNSGLYDFFIKSTP